MNQTQRVILVAGAVVILAMLLCPPWSIFGIASDEFNGYHLILGSDQHGHVHTSLLLLQIFGVGIATGLVFFAAKSKK